VTLDKPLLDILPEPEAVRDRLGDILREAKLLRALLRLSERAERYRHLDRQQTNGREVARA